MAILAMLLTAGHQETRAALLVGNLTASSDSSMLLQASTNYAATRITLGAGVVASNLDSIVFSVGAFTANTTATAYLAANVGGAPGAAVMSLGSQAIPQIFGDVTFTPSSSFVLQPGTTYWIVLYQSGSGGFVWNTTASSTLDPGGNPAAILTGNVFSPNSGVSWELPSGIQGHTYKLAVNATPVPEPGLLGLLGAGLVLAGSRRRRSQLA